MPICWYPSCKSQREGEAEERGGREAREEIKHHYNNMMMPVGLPVAVSCKIEAARYWQPLEASKHVVLAEISPACLVTWKHDDNEDMMGRQHASEE